MYPTVPRSVPGAVEIDELNRGNPRPSFRDFARPNPAFLNARPDDTFWAAQRVMAFSDEAIRAVVATARFSDPAATEYLIKALIKRRDQIGRTWLTTVNPKRQHPGPPDGGLHDRNAASERDIAGVASPAQAYSARWSLFDNMTGATSILGPWEPIGETQCAFPLNLPPAVPHHRRHHVHAMPKSRPRLVFHCVGRVGPLRDARDGGP